MAMYHLDFAGAHGKSTWEECLPIQEMWVRSLDGEDLLEKEMATHSSILPGILPGKFHGMRSLAGYSLWGHKRVGHDLVIKQHYQTSVNS